jgi:hypothetical protein
MGFWSPYTGIISFGGSHEGEDVLAARFALVNMMNPQFGCFGRGCERTISNRRLGDA